MAKSSIHFRPVKPNSQAHNERLTSLDYVKTDLTKNNEHWKAADISVREKEIRSHCRQVSGRKMMKNAEPIREAVVNLNDNHNLEDLLQLSKVLQKEKGIECFQIHIHRDEGKSREELNYHAHMLFDWQDKKTGKVRRLSPKDLSEIQTLVADSLKMERGELRVNSNRERLSPIEYKRQQEEKKLQQLRSEVKGLEQKKNRAATRNEKLKARIQTIEKEVQKTQTSVEQLALGGFYPEQAHRISEEEINNALKYQGEIYKRTEQLITEITENIVEHETKYQRIVAEITRLAGS